MACKKCCFNYQCNIDNPTLITPQFTDYPKHKGCNYFHSLQEVTSRTGDLIGFFLSSKPLFCTFEDDVFDELSFQQQRLLINEILLKILNFHTGIDKRYFISINEFLLLDSKVVEIISNVNRELKKRQSCIYLILCKKNDVINPYVREVEYQLKDNEVLIGLRIFEIEQYTVNDLEFYDFIFVRSNMVESYMSNSFFIVV